MPFYVQGHVVGLLGYSSLGKCVGEHDGGAMSGAPIFPEGVPGVRSDIAQLAAQARHSRAIIVLQREWLLSGFLFSGGGGVSDTVLHEDLLQLHLSLTGWWSGSSSSQLPRQVELGFEIPR